MAADYDTYDYPSYWIGRQYEHACEEIALKNYLNKITKINTLLEIGGGYGRLLPTYSFRAKKIILSDPSKKLLNKAVHDNPAKKIKIVQSTLENLSKKIGRGSIDVVLMIRVLHHIKNIDNAFDVISTLLNKNGFLILEFANKDHFKAMFSEIFKGNITFPIDIFPKDLRSKKSIRNKTLPFFNYHPDIITEKLIGHGFEIIERRSISNFRLRHFKSLFPIEVLLNIENKLQLPLSRLNFGPSIFLLARKK